MVFKKELERKYGIKKSTDNLGPIENTSESEDPNRKGRAKNIHSCRGPDNSSYSNVDDLFGVKDIWNFISKKPLLVRDSDGNIYSIYLDIENIIVEVDNDQSFLSKLESWDNYITSCINRYFQSKIGIDTSIGSDSSDSYIYRRIFDKLFDKLITSSESGRSDIRNHAKSSDLTLREESNDLDWNPNYKDLWVQCENEECNALNYKRFLKSRMYTCEECGYHFKMNSSERIEVLLDPGTWEPMDEHLFSLDPIKFEEEDRPYKDRIDSYQKKTGLTEAVQTGVGQVNGIPVAIGFMDFEFMGGSMGSVVGEKITRLIEYATNKSLPLIIVCASGGARMQEGSLSLMQMAKISSVLYDYQSTKKLFYVSILTSPTTGGVTASFGMLGDIIIAEPDSYIAFAGKRVIEETLKQPVPEGSQVAELLFKKGLFDLLVPRKFLKDVLSELLQLHAFFPLNSNSIK
uniref:Acetyl-coenzyme A carboxylase carboxyl transferase subunit beta, chloroplastic n=1 Tax=Dolichandrone spathacea TaxID=241844 RepID=A0A7T6XCJ1_9LAMI|nr:acetyl-CoA carboxylase beta subunit [Dolichandrone spathacea]QQK38285.1 acetyl-CoA carboxylase beta subunit [Dolichandrone spathacea]